MGAADACVLRDDRRRRGIRNQRDTAILTASPAPPRILQVTGSYYPEISSGGLQCQAVASHLIGRAMFQVLTTAVDPSLPAHATVDGIPTWRIHVDAARAGSKARALLRMLWGLLRIVPGVDIVHVHGVSRKNIPVIAVGKLFRRPVVLSLHTGGFDEPDAVARQGWLASWAFNAASRYLSVSPHLVAACVAAGVPPEKIRHVPNGVDLERFHPPASDDERGELRQALGLDRRRPVILFVGFFSREKQPHVLLDAWLRLSRDPSSASTLLFVGATRSAYFEVDDSLARDMRARADREGVGDRLIFVEPTHRVEEYYRAADVFVLPSSREGLPVALLEAMASGLPCIASRLPGATDVIIDDGCTGILVPPGDTAAIADAIQQLLRDRAKAAAMGAAARARVGRDYSVALVAARWLAAYRELSPRFA
jgi:glycosyltransferase involved in cell wall biosynthesis